MIISLLDTLTDSKEVFNKVINRAELQSINTNNVEENEDDNSKNKINPDKEIQISDVIVLLSNLTNTGWNFQETSINGEYEVNGMNYYYKDGFTLTRVGNRVRYVVFNEVFEKEIVSGIYPGVDLKDAKEKLGKPTFKNEDINMIGYATQNLFLCIYENEIAVYQNKYYSNYDLEEMLVKYYTGEYLGTANDFSRYIRNTYDDFIFTSDEERNIYLTSEPRGIVIKLDDSIKLTLYKNYDNSSATLLEKNMLENIEYVDKYMVEVIESERKLEE